jgi:hypothetical protein
MYKTAIPLLDVLMEEELYLSNIYPEEGRREGATLFYPNATLSEIEKVMCHPEVS